MKMNTLLGLTQHGETLFKAGINDYVAFFKSRQGAFQGERKTYEPAEGTVDDPSLRVSKVIETTVNEKLDYFFQVNEKYLQGLMNQEATNASGLVKAELVVGDESWGEFTSLELLRLKSLIPALVRVFQQIPVRSDSQQWEVSDDEAYTGRPGIFESPITETQNRSTIKEHYILPDPNVGEASGYAPQVALRTKQVSLGDITYQRFSGEWSHRQRAIALSKLSELEAAIIMAIKQANDVEAVSSDLNIRQVFDYLKG